MKKISEDFGDLAKVDEITPLKVIESNIVIKGIQIHVKSVFDDKVPLEKALGNIAFRKMKKLDKNNKF